ncbi:MAG: NHLP leader peptide family RiPP precursor [Clostridia bacterium]|nr:NHLP leader peptide family RiPP precursor [Clostridia bacterium]
MDMELIYNKIVEKADNDKSFRKKILQNAKEALKEIGITFPDDVNVNVYEDRVDDMHVMFPY